MENKPKITKAFEIRLPNKRFTIIWYDNNSVSFQTRTLQDSKKRIITRTSGIYSLESFLTLNILFQLLNDDYDFAKMKNPAVGQLNKKKIIVRKYIP